MRNSCQICLKLMTPGRKKTVLLLAWDAARLQNKASFYLIPTFACHTAHTLCPVTTRALADQRFFAVLADNCSHPRQSETFKCQSKMIAPTWVREYSLGQSCPMSIALNIWIMSPMRSFPVCRNKAPHLQIGFGFKMIQIKWPNMMRSTGFSSRSHERTSSTKTVALEKNSLDLAQLPTGIELHEMANAQNLFDKF